MSIDGAGILENDLAHDAYRQILDAWDAGVAVDEIRRRLAPLEEFAAEPIDEECLLAACLHAFREIGQDVQPWRDRLRALVDAGASLAAWAESGAALARRRRTVLARLLEQAATPKARPRPRRVHAPVKAKLFAVGDCLVLATPSRTWHALVEKVVDKRGRCEYMIVPMRSVRRATRRAFEAGKVFAHWIGSPDGPLVGAHVVRLEHRALLRAGNPFTTVAHVELDPPRHIPGSYGAPTEIADIAAHFERIERFPDRLGLHRGPIPLARMLRQGA
jgi:hypothetical protein